jgi:hypothetical protein
MEVSFRPLSGVIFGVSFLMRCRAFTLTDTCEGDGVKPAGVTRRA